MTHPQNELPSHNGIDNLLGDSEDRYLGNGFMRVKHTVTLAY